MLLQYVIGPEYRYYAGVLPLHLALFTLGAGIAVASWNAIDPGRLPPMARRSRRTGVVTRNMGPQSVLGASLGAKGVEEPFQRGRPRQL